MITRFSAEKFSNLNDCMFSPIDYSKFKFGSKSIAKQFGKRLAEAFIASPSFRNLCILMKVNDCNVVVAPSPYVFIPTATFALKDYFVRYLNEALYLRGLKPVIEAKIYRSSSYKADYGALDAEQRDKIMSDDNFYMDEHWLQFPCIFLDDIIITGGHERRMRKMLEQFIKNNFAGTYNFFFLYYAELTSGLTNPTIENDLNYAYVKCLEDINNIREEGHFIINTRVVKYALDAPHIEFYEFINKQPRWFLDTLYSGAIGNRYNLIPDYQSNFNYLNQCLSEDEK